MYSGAIMLARFKKRWLTVVAAGLVLFETQLKPVVSQSWEDGPAVHGRSATLLASSLTQTVRAVDRSPPQVPLAIADSRDRWRG
ncbi:MAG: hypothetical protein ABSG40_19720 [Terriglobales bacterium]|jgi:hypothetical protein